MNTNELREKMVRNILASLLHSASTDEELLLMGAELDGALLSELQRKLNSFHDAFQKPSSAPATHMPKNINADSNHMLAETIYLLAKNKRVSKDRFKSYLSQISPHTNISASINESLRDLVYRIVETGDESTVYQLLERLGGNIGEDPYLEGISRGNN